MSAARTPIGSINGSLASVRGPDLGAIAIKGAITKAGLTADQIQEVIMGNVVSAGIGQAPGRQAAIYAGIPESATCTTVNKVCASGMKAVMYAAQSIMLGYSDIVVAGETLLLIVVQRVWRCCLFNRVNSAILTEPTGLQGTLDNTSYIAFIAYLPLVITVFARV